MTVTHGTHEQPYEDWIAGHRSDQEARNADPGPSGPPDDLALLTAARLIKDGAALLNQGMVLAQGWLEAAVRMGGER